jgi:hypothetical protein
MSLHLDYLRTLERVSQIDKPVMADQLLGRAAQFLQRRWLVEDGYLSAITVEVLDGEDEVDVTVDAQAGTYSFKRLGGLTEKITRPLFEITVYAFNMDAWLDDVAKIFEIEPLKVARKRELIATQLWHLGDLRVGKSHQFAPLYVGRRLHQCSAALHKELLDPIRPRHGIVAVFDDRKLELPGGHQERVFDALVFEDAEPVRCNTELLARLLDPEANRDDSVDAFDDRGLLKLRCMAQPKTFQGKQKQVIALLWRLRSGPSVKWSEIREMTDCAKDPDSVFGKACWRQWIERVGHGEGLYRLRT